MSIAEDLAAELGQGGFDIGATLDVSAGDIGTVSVDPSGIDVDALGGIVDGLDGAGTGDVTAIVGDLLGQLADVLGDIPVVDDALEPLTRVLELVDLLTGSMVGDVVGAIDGSVEEDLLSGLPALEARFAAARAIKDDPSVTGLLDVATGLLDESVDLDATVGDLGGWLIAIRDLVGLVGGLMAVESASLDLRRLTEMASEMLVPSELEAAAAAAARFRGSSLDDLLVGIDPNDGPLVDLVAQPIVDYSLAVRRLAAVVGRGMAFGEATLAAADIDGLAGRLDTGAATLREEGLGAVRGLAEQVAGWLQPLLDIELPDTQSGLDEFADQVVGVVGDLSGAIDQLDPAALAGPVTAGFDDALAVFDQVAVAAEEVRTLLGNSLGAVREVVQGIDLGPVLDTVTTVIEPIADALAAVEAIVGDAQAGIEATSDEAIAALETVKTSLETASGAIDEAFGRVDGFLTALGLDSIQANLEAIIRPVADGVASADLGPFFDTAGDVIDGAADVLDKVPLSLLPDDALEDLAEAVEPVKAIDFQRDVADVLNAKLDEIFETLNTDVLDAIESAYQEVVAFLDSIDPAVALEELEAEVFDPMIEAVRSIDLDTVLTPLEEAIEPVKEAIVGFDPIGEVIAPIDALLAEVVNQVEAFDPAILLEPLEAQLAGLTNSAAEALMLDQWAGWLDQAEQITLDGLARLDLNQLVDALDGAYDGLIDEVRGGAGGPSALGTIIAGLLESTGLSIRADCFGTITGWIGGVDGATEVNERLGAAAVAVDGLLAAVEAVDLQVLIADLQPMHRSITTALEIHPADSALRLRLDVELAASSPQALLAPLLDSHANYLAGLRDVAVTMRRLAASGRSEITAISQGLRESLRPLSAYVSRIRALLTAVGLDPEGTSPREIVVELLQTFRPSRLLAPLTGAVDALRAKLEQIASDGLIGPLRDAVASVQAVFDAVDIGFIRTELSATHAEIVELILGLSPSEVLGDVLTELEDLQVAIDGFDPLGPVREAVDAMTVVIDEVDAEFRPTVLFAPATDLYQRIVDALGALDVAGLLQPVLDALDGLRIQLGGGLDTTAAALTRLQDALPDASDLGGSAGGGASVSAGVG